MPKPKTRVLMPINPKIIKEASTRKNLVQGLKNLNSLWKRGILPKDLDAHYYITWLAYSNGNNAGAARLLGIHRNSIHHFLKKLHTKNPIQFRKILTGINQNTDLSKKVKALYDRARLKPHFSNAENKALVNLWLMGMPRKIVNVHFYIWNFQKGLELKDISQKMRVSYRTIIRLRTSLSRPGSPAKKWLESLKVNKKDLTFPRYRRRSGSI
jgi:DNA-binding protein Fis